MKCSVFEVPQARKFSPLQGVYKGFALISERRRREIFWIKIIRITKNKNVSKKIRTKKIQENPRNYLFSSNKNEQNSEDLNQKIRTVNK